MWIIKKILPSEFNGKESEREGEKQRGTEREEREIKYYEKCRDMRKREKKGERKEKKCEREGKKSEKNGRCEVK